VNTIEELEKQLQERIEALDKQRREEAAKFEEEKARRDALREAEKLEWLEQIRAKESARLEKKRKDEEELEKARQENERIRIEAERALNAADTARIKQEEKLNWLLNRISEVEFMEDQRNKARQNALIVPITEVLNPADINVEHPESPVNKDKPGNAVEGTEGSTPENASMSFHLKQILRQAGRNY